MNKEFSFIILTFNEEIHLPRLLHSIKELNAPTFILDSFSTDGTRSIAGDFNVPVKQNKFENHPQQWHAALTQFEIKTPWTIGLDADQTISQELLENLENFSSEDFEGINGIYFNRKNYFRGKWIKYGGFYPKYLLKMFRTGIGYSDLSESMDHRFVIQGKSIIWKTGYLIEENLKENKISFWIDKHNRYSDLVALEEIEREKNIRIQSIKPDYWGDPNERLAYLKSVWRRLPLGLRPFLYFFFRIIFQLGFLDGRRGMLFHFLQGFWFRLIVDVKIKEYKNLRMHNKD